MAHLASTFWHQRRWKEAEELEVQVMKISKPALNLKTFSTGEFTRVIKCFPVRRIQSFMCRNPIMAGGPRSAICAWLEDGRSLMGVFWLYFTVSWLFM
ncbi:hypothetical protein GX50_00811 [[Emmonsia] crescens]|uniref:Uncharacterized protein n=1 Tax=[Emmonsia] crescens TaxID=73230 RepID=A0A2B7ZQM9_9EURO|nr:hypothetical protein GX50_00811 [Emmonsia crescens]